MSAADAPVWMRRGPPRLRKRTARLPERETAIQIAVMNHLRMFGPRDALIWHAANEKGGRSTAENKRLKAEGVLAGVSDVCIVSHGRFYALELKTSTGVLSDAQEEFLNGVHRNGFTAAVAYGLDAALDQLRAWGLLPPDRSVRLVGEGL
jgi:hypothetical protein